jgi:hypothetical protein
MGKLKIINPNEILEAGGFDAWAKKNNYRNTGKSLIGKIKLTPKLEKITAKALLDDESKKCPL